ncbi:DUF1853 family protein [Tenacibaculum amylolyticum]|uniref:DUF1853 family protein n=1 Tax=Tenacibaculum amylolyticum TaxID=104269 RepID=UPI0038953D56
MHYKDKEIQLQYQGFSITKPLWINTLNKINQFTDLQLINTFKPKVLLHDNLRLGKLVEQFIFYQLAANQNIEIILENIQVQNGNITVGELDGIILQNNIPIHLEIVYKFYLYDATVGTAEMEHWIGPNRRDSFNEKFQKLRKKQLPLLYHEKTRELLAHHDLDVNTIQQKVYFKAQLFPHLNDSNKEFPLINNDCISGFYIYLKELAQFKECKFYIPTKHNWLVIPHTNVKWLNFDAFKADLSIFLEKTISPLCWMKKPNGTLLKLFVVWW